MIEKLERNFYVGMWLIGDEAAKFAVASGLTNSEKEFLDEEFIHEDVLRWEAWDNVHFKGVGLIYPGLQGVQFYTLEGTWMDKSWTQTELDAPIILIDAQRQPMPFGTAYANEEELLQEFRTRFGKYLPNDFDFKSHIGIYEAYDNDS